MSTDGGGAKQARQHAGNREAAGGVRSVGLNGRREAWRLGIYKYVHTYLRPGENWAGRTVRPKGDLDLYVDLIKHRPPSRSLESSHYWHCIRIL